MTTQTEQKKKKERLRLSKPLQSTGSHHTADPNHWSRLVHIWGLNEANDLRQATGELFLPPQYKWKCPESFHSHYPSSLYTFYSYHWCGKLWTFNCLARGGLGIFCFLLLKCHFVTSLKLSNAERMISCPPRTRQTAASSSSTKAFVLQAQETHVQRICMKHIWKHLTNEK